MKMGNDLRKRRKALGLSQMELARLVGVSLLTIQTWERGVSKPKPENREKLEQVLSELAEGREVFLPENPCCFTTIEKE